MRFPSLRLLLVVFLLLMQAAAPLAHAHRAGVQGSAGIHVHWDADLLLHGMQADAGAAQHWKQADHLHQGIQPIGQYLPQHGHPAPTAPVLALLRILEIPAEQPPLRADPDLPVVHQHVSASPPTRAPPAYPA